jgi:hypothetical protein
MSEAKFDRLKNYIAHGNSVPFSYDKDAQRYAFGDNQYTAEDVTETDRFWEIREEPLSDGEVDELITNSAAIHTALRLITLPRFRDFVRDGWNADVEAEVTEVMRDVMNSMVPVPKALMSASPDHLGFGAMVINRRMGRLVLQVPGNCACLGPDATAFPFREMLWEEGVFVNTFHNTDTPPQRAALLAGLGHVAGLATRLQPV